MEQKSNPACKVRIDVFLLLKTFVVHIISRKSLHYRQAMQMRLCCVVTGSLKFYHNCSLMATRKPIILFESLDFGFHAFTHTLFPLTKTYDICILD